MIMELFDSEFIKSLPGIDKFSNPYVVFLCKSKDPRVINLRSQIENWFQNLSVDSQKEMFPKLRSLDDVQHLPAFYELVFNQYALEEDWKVTKDPDIQGQHPDFLINYRGDSPFYLEVATIFKEKKLEKEEEKFNKLLRKIDQLDTLFFISVHLEKWLGEDVNYAKIVLFIKKWLGSLRFVPDKIHRIELNEFGFEGNFNASHRKGGEKKFGCVGSWMPPVRSGSWYTKEIREILANKRKKYKFLKRDCIPFVIALCSGGDFFFDQLSLEWALYGQEQIVVRGVNTSEPRTEFRRAFDGLITPKPALGIPRNTRISAVLFCEREWGLKGEQMLYNMKVYHNPWAVNPLDAEVFKKLPQFVKAKEDEMGITMGWINNKKQLIFFR